MSNSLRLPTLVLNSAWQPISVASVRKSLQKVFAGAAALMDHESFALYDFENWCELPVKNGHRIITLTNGGEIRAPEIIVLRNYDRFPEREVKLTRRNLLIRDNFTCFPPNTLITMSDLSQKEIACIRIGDRILDAYGKEQVVEHVHVRNFNTMTDTMVRLRKIGCGDGIASTADHRILTTDKNGERINETKAIAIKSILAHKRNADYLFEPKIKDFHEGMTKLEVVDLGSDELLDGYAFVTTDGKSVATSNGKWSIERQQRIDRELGWLVGLYLAEGSITGNGNAIVFSLCSDEQDIADRVRDIIRQKFGVETTQSIDTDHNKLSVFCCSSVIARFFKQWCYEAGDKRVRRFNLPKEYFEGLLAGLIDGDGYVHEAKRKITLMMSRKRLIYDAKIVANICGIYPLLSPEYSRADGRKFCSIIFTLSQYNLLVELMGLPIKRSYHNLNQGYRIFTESKVLSRVRQIESTNYEGQVFDLQVSGSHTYIANFIAVHNCQYTGKKLTAREATIDHVLPQSRTGKTTWENVVICCPLANTRKADKTPGEAGMHLLKQPRQPKWSPVYSRYARYTSTKSCPESWKKFVDWDPDTYWDIELDED